MRIYFIANDGITLCPEMPAVMTEGEVAVASKPEHTSSTLCAAPRAGKLSIAHNSNLHPSHLRRSPGQCHLQLAQEWHFDPAPTQRSRITAILEIS
jgi:hypothetical protein